jgi:hypothetical protein
MGSVPRGRAVVTRVATWLPLTAASGAEPRTVVPLLKVTLPVGV